MTRVQHQEIEYPESDGQPMAESDLHRRWMFDILEILERHFRNQQVYVTGALLLYYVEGDIEQVIVPDAYFVKGRPLGNRCVYKLWEEGVPNAVVETTSRDTQEHDMGRKFELYEQLGVKEYVLYDPEGDYLDPRLRVYQLRRGKYERVKSNSQGEMPLREAGLNLSLDAAGGLRFFDMKSGNRVCSWREAAETADAARDRADAERARADREVASIAKLKAEIARLKRKLGE